MAFSLYIHIPFCKSRCLYCDFCSTNHLEDAESYVDALEREYALLMAAYPEVMRFKSIFVGGGTPTAISDRAFDRLLALISRLPKTADYEWTMEANPESATPNKLRAMRLAGCNRLSMGLQDFEPTVLKTLGRIHTAETFVEAFHQARAVGFENVSADLMFGIPGQTLESFTETVRRLVALGPEHISTYSLKLEEGTRLEALVSSGKLPEPDEGLDRDIYAMLCEQLRAAGYEQYELSNFCKPGYACTHNLAYWHNERFVGLGLSSAYFMGHERIENLTDIAAYLETVDAGRLPIGHKEEITPEMERFETLFLALRLNEGLNIAAFEQRTGVDFEAVYGEKVSEMIQSGLLTQEAGVVKLTALGRDLSNSVFVTLMD